MERAARSNISTLKSSAKWLNGKSPAAKVTERKKVTVLTNDEILMFAMRRSGHHAIINWILAHYQGETLHCNDLLTDYGHNTAEIRFRDSDLYVLINNTSGAPQNYQSVLTNIEDSSLSVLLSNGRLFKHDREFPYYPFCHAKRKLKILIIRDPYNLFASRLRMAEKVNEWPHEREWWKEHAVSEGAISMWCEHAREFLGDTSYINGPKLMINYNEWFASAQYRNRISRTFPGVPTDESLRQVSHHGHGSSFDQLRFCGRGSKMNVLQRWKKYASLPFYQEIFRRHPQLNELSLRIFGWQLLF